MKKKATSSGRIGICGLLLVTFIVLKLCGVIEWGWFWVLAPLAWPWFLEFAPLWIPIAIGIICLIIVVVLK